MPIHSVKVLVASKLLGVDKKGGFKPPLFFLFIDKEIKMLIEILKSCGVSGESILKGEKLELPDKDATYLIGMGKAKEATPEVKTEAKPAKKKATKK